MLCRMQRSAPPLLRPQVSAPKQSPAACVGGQGSVSVSVALSLTLCCLDLLSPTGFHYYYYWLYEQAALTSSVMALWLVSQVLKYNNDTSHTAFFSGESC